MKNHPVGTEVFHEDRQTNTYEEALSFSLQVCEHA